MPKVLPLTKIERKKLEFHKWIKGKKASEDITESHIGKEMGVCQSAVSKKIKESQYSYTDLVILFKTVNATDEEILRLMKL